MAKKTLQPDTAPVKRLTLKKSTVKDLSVPVRVSRRLNGGRSSSGGSVVRSVASSAGG